MSGYLICIDCKEVIMHVESDVIPNFLERMTIHCHHMLSWDSD